MLAVVLGCSFVFVVVCRRYQNGRGFYHNLYRDSPNRPNVSIIEMAAVAMYTQQHQNSHFFFFSFFFQKKKMEGKKKCLSRRKDDDQ